MSANEHPIRYFVNGEKEISQQASLTVGQILDLSGFTPIEEYTLKSENPPRDYASNYNDDVTIHENQRFQARHKGPTPTS